MSCSWFTAVYIHIVSVTYPVTFIFLKQTCKFVPWTSWSSATDDTWRFKDRFVVLQRALAAFFFLGVISVTPQFLLGQELTLDAPVADEFWEKHNRNSSCKPWPEKCKPCHLELSNEERGSVKSGFHRWRSGQNWATVYIYICIYIYLI